MTEENIFLDPDADNGVSTPVPETESPEEGVSAPVQAEFTPLIPGTEILGRCARRAAMMAESAVDQRPPSESEGVESPDQIPLWENEAVESADPISLWENEAVESADQIPLWENDVAESADPIPFLEEETADGAFSDSFEMPEQESVPEEISVPESELPDSIEAVSEPESPSLRSVVDAILTEEDYYTPVDQIPHRRRRTAEEVPHRPVKKNGSAVSPFVEFVEIVVGALVAAILVLTLICRTGVVEGDSMVPTMHSGDRYVISDLFYTPEQGDIVVFRPEIDGEDELWIKRVIALEGQTVYIDPNSYRVYVDGKLLDEPYLGGAGTIPHTTENPITVPEGCVYVLGDNRAISHDSRYEDLGCVEIGQLAGRVILRFWPLEDFGFCE